MERGRVLSDQMIRVDGERIVAIGDYKADANAGGQWVDWSRYTVLPA